MLQEDKQILWRVSAVLIGAALPTMLLGKAVMFVLLLMGIFSGLMATKDESLRATMRLLADSKVTLLALVLMGSLLVGVSTGINVEYSFERWGQVAFVGFCGALLFVALREMPGKHLELLMKVLAISTIAMATLAFTDAMAHWERLSIALHGDARMAASPYRLNSMSSVLAVLLPFVWARLLLKSREGEPFAVRIALPVASFLLLVALVSGGRAGWMGLFAGMAVFLFMLGRYHGLVIHKKHWFMAAGLFVLAAGLYVFASNLDFVMQRISVVGEEGHARGALSGRGAVWGQAMAWITQQPLFGIGVMNYRNMPAAIDMHPHNWLLQMLLEGGVVSTLIFIGLMGMVWLRFNTFAKGSIYGAAALASLTAFLVAGLANTSIFNGWWMTYLIVVCVLGWRVGWGGVDLKKRRRAPRVVKPGTSLE